MILFVFFLFFFLATFSFCSLSLLKNVINNFLFLLLFFFVVFFVVCFCLLCFEAALLVFLFLKKNLTRHLPSADASDVSVA